MNWCHVCLFYICEEISKHFHLRWSDLISTYQFLHQVVLLSKSVVQENTFHELRRYLVVIGHVLNYYHYQSQGRTMVWPWRPDQYPYDYQGQPCIITVVRKVTMREHGTKFWVSLATEHPGQIQSQFSRMENGEERTLGFLSDLSFFSKCINLE